MVEIPFLRESQPVIGQAEAIHPLVRRVVCGNPSPFTYHGTNSYIVGRGRLAIIDPGPVDDAHLHALLHAVRNETVTHIIVTHTHRDHSPGAAALKAATGAATWAFGPHGVRPGPGVEAGGDTDFQPDHRLADGESIAGAGWTLTAVHTPGHTSNHLSFALAEANALFSADHVMAWSTSVVSPPDGDMGAYMASLRKLLAREDALYWPGHGPALPDPKPYVAAVLAHREEREQDILGCLAEGLDTVPAIVTRLYTHVPQKMHAAAGRSVLAHLISMVQTGRVRCEGAPTTEARFRL